MSHDVKTASDHLGRTLPEVWASPRPSRAPIIAGAAAVLPLAVIVVGLVLGAFHG